MCNVVGWRTTLRTLHTLHFTAHTSEAGDGVGWEAGKVGGAQGMEAVLFLAYSLLHFCLCGCCQAVRVSAAVIGGRRLCYWPVLVASCAT